MLENRHLGNGHVGDITGGNWAAVYYLELPRLSQWGKGKIMMAYKSFVYKGDSSSSRVKKCISLNCPILEGKRAVNH